MKKLPKVLMRLRIEGDTGFKLERMSRGDEPMVCAVYWDGIEEALSNAYDESRRQRLPLLVDTDVIDYILEPTVEEEVVEEGAIA